jgi:putative component of toxin-antitoxin plasmid stabilization module
MGSGRGDRRSAGHPGVAGSDAVVTEPGEGLFDLRFTLGPTARRITYRFTKDGRIVLLTTFRKQRNNERDEINRAHRVAAECALRYP